MDGFGGKSPALPKWKNEKVWLVQFQGEKGKKSKSFSKKEYNTKEAALEAALIWRRKFAEEKVINKK